MKKSIILLVIALSVSSISAQFINYNKGKIKQKNYYQEIPYQEIKGIIIVPVSINGKIYKFIFDTGASTLAISDKIFKELNLKSTKHGTAIDASNESVTAKLILLPEIDFQEITFLNISGGVFPKNSDASEFAECFGIDGMIGSNMLKKSVVQFDEKRKLITITNDIKRVLLQNNKSQKMKLSWCCPYVTVTLQKGEEKAIHKALFDSGDAGSFFTLSLNDIKGGMVNTIAESEGSFGLGAAGFHKKQKHLLLNIPELVINEIIFSDITVTTTHSNHSRIGNKLLQYGITTLDYKKKRFYFTPYENSNTRELSEKPWAIGYTIQNNKLAVGIIWDKALESQINFGDEILSINGIDIQLKNFCELLKLDDIPSFEKNIYEIKDINTGAIKRVEIKRLQLRE